MLGVSQRNQGFANLCRGITRLLKGQPVQPLTDAQMHAFGVDSGQLCRYGFRQSGQLDVMGDSLGVVAIHMFDHTYFRLASKRVDRKSTRLNSSHVAISYAVFCLKKKKKQ